jgi:4-aminobutyrate aminotransferase-like enzyme/ribosomal protein S18 acetylase RimI-like enzyme
MKLPLINAEDASYAFEILKKYYDEKLIPSEKKNYLTDLKNSIGPYMGIQSKNGETHYFLDAASQIATLGNGFNASIFFGATEFLESWTNDSTTKEFKEMRLALVNFFQRKLQWKKTFMTFAHSGAEANELALGYCYRARVNKEANKVLAFKNSFHGRMMITLAATWNKSKREPFEWADYTAHYVKYPELNNDLINRSMPKNWRETWNEASLKNFVIPNEWESFKKNDAEISIEIESLLEVREALASKKIFAIIIEPMQCEGGDCYSSDRFHTALLLLSKAFKVPVIYDEVQTGFHLGKEFFWHKEFNLTGIDGQKINPDFVTCAKKAQIGIVLSHKDGKNIFKGEEFSVASAFRGYAHAIYLDQSQNAIIKIQEEIKIRLNKLLEKHSEYILRPRVNGLAFAFDLKDAALLNKFVDIRFKHGLLYYPAGNQTLRFRMNTAMTSMDLDFLFDRLSAIVDEICENKFSEIPNFVEVDQESSQNSYLWHQLLIELKLTKLQNKKIDTINLREKLEVLLDVDKNYKLIEINSQNFLNYREEIINLQKIVYEPARQTDIEKFEHTVLNQHSLNLGIIKNEKLFGIAFAGPLKLYPLERGVRNDPHYNDEDSLYMLDLTIHPDHANNGLGRSLKYALSAMAISYGIKRIQGRNRDRLARAMLSINLSLGAIEQNYMPEDYPDFEAHRDVFYYTAKADWKKSSTHLSHGISIPLTHRSLDLNYVSEQMPFLVNKICLSNFISESFISKISKIMSLLPKNLQHGYTTSGQSECVDKVIKSIWYKSDVNLKTKNPKMLTFHGHFFGNGSNLSRSLSIDNDPYFNVFKLNNPTEENYAQILIDVENEFKNNIYLAVWLEPLMQKTMERVPYQFLKELRKLTIKYKVVLIYNETASSMYRYSHKEYFISNFSDLTPDAGFFYTGGQSGIVYVLEKYFLELPLMLISTWDGDEFSLMSYYKVFENIQNNKQEYFEIIKKFQGKVIDQLCRFELDSIKIENGVGNFKGSIPSSIEKLFKRNENHQYIICASFDVMKEYI